MRDIHPDDIGACAEQGPAAGNGAAFYFLLVLEVVASIGGFYDAAFDFTALVVKLRFLLPHAEVYDQEVMYLRVEVDSVFRELCSREVGDLSSRSRRGSCFGWAELNGNLHVHAIVHADDQVGELAVARRKLAYFSERRCFGGSWGVGHDNECLGETRYHQKRKGGAGILTVLVLHKPSSLYHRGVRLGWYQKRLVLDDGVKVRRDLVDLQ